MDGNMKIEFEWLYLNHGPGDPAEFSSSDNLSRLVQVVKPSIEPSVLNLNFIG